MAPSALRAVLVDSDAGARAATRHVLVDIPTITLVGEYSGLAEALLHAAATRPDLLLVELDTRQSDIVTFLDLRPRYSILDVVENIGRMDESLLRGLLTRHASGLWTVPGPTRLERGQLSPEQVSGAIEVLRSYFDHVLMDLRHDFDPGTIAALEASDVILFVTSLDLAALRSGAAALA